MTITKRKKKEMAETFREFYRDLAAEKLSEMTKFIDAEIVPNAPSVMQFIEGIKLPEDLHPRYGLNPHQLGCGRCHRPTQLAVPLCKSNALWQCPSCGVQMHGVEDEFLNCPHCKALMTRKAILKPDDPVHFDYHCKACRESKPAQIKIATTGGAMILCPECHTTGTLPATDKDVIAFRKEHNLGPEVEVRFLLEDTQCPRCADQAAERPFTELEEKRVFLHEDDRANGFFKKLAPVKTREAKSRGTGKKSSKPAPVVGPVEAGEDDFEPAVPKVLFHHPGSKNFH